ncbi:cytochrome P450 3A14 [Nephila pilipes]|uniref:Cytochrome P450 3A14 n=1 Tax=Nephila pilipes TaxID=299642 RepID=A0A8X6UBE2_NEPPI|nr:cytochrome P450 3A14 [Nephila pilipes]
MEGLLGLIFTPLGVALLLGIAFVWFIRNSSKTHDCWKKLGVPYVQPKPFFGSILDNINKPFHENELERYKQFGPIYGHFQGSAPLLSVADPELLRNIMVKDFQFFTNRRGLKTGDTITECMLQLLEGEDWKRVRTIVTPTFTTGKIKRMMDIFTSCSKVLVENFRKVAEKGEPVDAKKIYGAFTMDIIASAAFSTKLDSHNDPNNKFVRVARNVFHQSVNYRFIFYLLFPRIMRLFRVPIFPPEGVKFFTDVTLRIIEERKRTGQKRNDFLQLLLDTAEEQKVEIKSSEKSDDILNNYAADENDQVFKNFKGKKTLSTNELIAQCVIFFLAGFETTASTLAFVSYYLALNPDVQDKLVAEIDETVKEGNGELTYEAIQNMKYLDNVISETLRINPPSVRLERVTGEDYKLGDTGVVVPKGTTITIPIYAIQRDAKYFPNPETFDPDRFASPEGQCKPLAKYVFYFAFGTGPRGYVGMRFCPCRSENYALHMFSVIRSNVSQNPRR